jgi:hypothetical protein
MFTHKKAMKISDRAMKLPFVQKDNVCSTRKPDSACMMVKVYTYRLFESLLEREYAREIHSLSQDVRHPINDRHDRNKNVAFRRLCKSNQSMALCKTTLCSIPTWTHVYVCMGRCVQTCDLYIMYTI